MGIAAGTIYQADCGAVVVFSAECPDEEVRVPTCGCGAEMHRQVPSPREEQHPPAPHP